MSCRSLTGPIVDLQIDLITHPSNHHCLNACHTITGARVSLSCMIIIRDTCTTPTSHISGRPTQCWDTAQGVLMRITPVERSSKATYAGHFAAEKHSMEHNKKHMQSDFETVYRYKLETGPLHTQHLRTHKASPRCGKHSCRSAEGHSQGSPQGKQCCVMWRRPIKADSTTQPCANTYRQVHRGAGVSQPIRQTAVVSALLAVCAAATLL